MKQLLKTYFGYDEFRPLQEEVVEGFVVGLTRLLSFLRRQESTATI